jgi:hypothetical protein
VCPVVLYFLFIRLLCYCTKILLTLSNETVSPLTNITQKAPIQIVNIKCILRRISELFRDRVVQYFVDLRFAEVKKNLSLVHLRNLLICEHQQKSANILKCVRFKWVLKLQKYSCLDSSMVEHLLVIDIIACHYKSLHVNLRWLGMRVQSQLNSLYLLLHF